MRSKLLPKSIAGFILALSVLSFSAFARAGGPVLVIIDMQDRFQADSPWANTRLGARLIEQILIEQSYAIQTFRELNFPILLIEYYNEGITNATVRNALEGYALSARLKKSTDGLFDPQNINLQALLLQLRAWDADELIVMGANANVCVKQSILGALDNGMKVASFGNGILDFNQSKFVSPHRYTDLHHPLFRQLEDFAPFTKMNQCRAAYANSPETFRKDEGPKFPDRARTLVKELVRKFGEKVCVFKK